MKSFFEDIKIIGWALFRFLCSFVIACIVVGAFMLYNTIHLNIYPHDEQIYWGGGMIVASTVVIFLLGPRLIKSFFFSAIIIGVTTLLFMMLSHKMTLTTVEIVWLGIVFVLSFVCFILYYYEPRNRY